MEPWIVLLHRHEDLDQFYADMETSGGSDYIPNRAVDIECRRPISRSTMYQLDSAEANLLLQDSRVKSVIRWADFAEYAHPEPAAFTRENFIYDKGAFETPNSEYSKNWATWRSRNTYADNSAIIDAWCDVTEAVDASGASDSYTGSESFTETGKNVDIVILDGHPNPDHPDFQVNADGTGGTRVNEINWHTYTDEVKGYNSGFSNNYFLQQNYVYSPYIHASDASIDRGRNHGCSVASNAAGSWFGMAPGANIYSLSPYTSDQRDRGNIAATNSTLNYTMIDYIRIWHKNKAINPATGCKNPTIVNASIGFSTEYDNTTTIWPVQVTNRGTTIGDGVTNLTNVQLEAGQVKSSITSAGRVFSLTIGTGGQSRHSWIDSIIADMEDAINDGIHFVLSAGNNNTLMAYPNTTEHTDNTMTLATGETFSFKNRSFASNHAILVGCISGQSRYRAGGSTGQGEGRIDYSNTGVGVDIYAFGDGTKAAVNGITNYSVLDPRDPGFVNRTFNGTSAAAPMCTGILACILERYPDLAPPKAKALLLSRARDRDTHGEIGDLGQGWPNQYSFDTLETPKVAMHLGNIRKETGRLARHLFQGARPSSGVTYPRQRIVKTRRTVL